MTPDPQIQHGQCDTGVNDINVDVFPATIIVSVLCERCKAQPRSMTDAGQSLDLYMLDSKFRPISRDLPMERFAGRSHFASSLFGHVPQNQLQALPEFDQPRVP
jgi:hypothetical protein